MGHTLVEVKGRPTVDRERFRDAIGRFASGVTVVTTSLDGRAFGTTASAMTSLSLEPPMLLVCLNETSDTQAVIRRTGSFAVNVLAEGQDELAKRFATKSPAKFEGLSIVWGATGLPLLTEALAQFECSVTDTVAGGTHYVFLAEVLHARAHEGAPLTYFRGRFGRFDDSLNGSRQPA